MYRPYNFNRQVQWRPPIQNNNTNIYIAVGILFALLIIIIVAVIIIIKKKETSKKSNQPEKENSLSDNPPSISSSSSNSSNLSASGRSSTPGSSSTTSNTSSTSDINITGNTPASGNTSTGVNSSKTGGFSTPSNQPTTSSTSTGSKTSSDKFYTFSPMYGNNTNKCLTLNPIGTNVSSDRKNRLYLSTCDSNDVFQKFKLSTNNDIKTPDDNCISIDTVQIPLTSMNYRLNKTVDSKYSKYFYPKIEACTTTKDFKYNETNNKIENGTQQSLFHLYNNLCFTGDNSYRNCTGIEQTALQSPLRDQPYIHPTNIPNTSKILKTGQWTDINTLDSNLWRKNETTAPSFYGIEFKGTAKKIKHSTDANNQSNWCIHANTDGTITMEPDNNSANCTLWKYQDLYKMIQKDGTNKCIQIGGDCGYKNCMRRLCLKDCATIGNLNGSGQSIEYIKDNKDDGHRLKEVGSDKYVSNSTYYATYGFNGEKVGCTSEFNSGNNNPNDYLIMRNNEYGGDPEKVHSGFNTSKAFKFVDNNTNNDPCFDGESSITLYNGSTKKIKELIKGDEVLSINGNKSLIRCIIKNKVGCKIQLSNINNMLITPWHPIKINNKWIFPNDMNPPSDVYIDYIYNIVLNDHHIVYINGIEVVTLGHNFTDSIVSHPYLGTSRVINDLERISGFNEGLIENIKAVRSEDTGLICKFIKNDI
jgi:hypothetical protein